MRRALLDFGSWRWQLAASACLCLATFSLAALPTASQESPPPDVSGRYEGFAESKVYGKVPLVLDVRYDKGRIVGLLQTPLGDFEVSKVSYSQGTLVFTAESYDDEAVIALVWKNKRFVGSFDGFGDKGAVELQRTGPAPPVVDKTPTDNLSKQAWREDLQNLAKELPRRHANAFHAITREQFERAVNQLDLQISSLQNSDIVMGLSRIAAMIGDGHTHLRWGALYKPVPLRLYWFGNELRVTGTTTEYRQVLGTRVVAIAGHPISDIYTRDLPYISQGESEGFVKSANAELLTYPAHLHALGVAPDLRSARYTFRRDSGAQFDLTLRIPGPGEHVQWIDAARRTPLYRQRESEPLWFTYLEPQKTLYFSFNAYPRRKEFVKFSHDLFEFIDRHEINRVIVDMRQNGGGDFTRGRDYVISEFKKRPAITKPGMLYVVIGRWTYSAGMANAADFRNDFQAIMVGEPTGARPNGYQENREFRLPNSHLGVSYSTQLYKFQERDTPGIMPDKRIDPDWGSYKRGEDQVVGWIMRQKLPS